MNIVSEETFGQMVDNNIGFALQRLPGISVNEDQDGAATGFNTNPWFVFEYEMIKPWEGLVHVNVINGVDSTDLSLMSEGELEEVTSKKYEDVYSARLDWERKFVQERSTFTLKSGAKYRSSKPRFNRTSTGWEMDEDFPYSRVVTPTNEVLFLKPKYFDVQPRQGEALARSNPELFSRNALASLQASNLADYDAKEETSAAYGMGTFRFGAHTIIGGVRLEKNEWSSKRMDVRVGAGNVGVVTPVNRGASYNFWLPGIHLRHEPIIATATTTSKASEPISRATNTTPPRRRSIWRSAIGCARA